MYFSYLFVPNQVRCCFDSRNNHQFLPSHLKTAFCHHSLSESQSYHGKSHPEFGWMFGANGQSQLSGGGCDKPDVGSVLAELVPPSASSSYKLCPAALAPAPVYFINAGNYDSGHACFLCYLSGSFANPLES